MLQEYKLKEGGFNEIRKQMLRRALPVLLIIIVFVVAINMVNAKGEMDFTAMFIMIPVIIAAIGWGIFRGLNRQKKLLESYTFIITHNMVIREQENTPDISFYFNEISEIAKTKNGGFTIKGNNSPDVIIIPAQIDNYSTLEAALQQLQPIITNAKEPVLQKYRIVISLLTLALMFVVYTSYNKLLVGICGGIVVILMARNIYLAWSNKNIDAKTKRGLWWSLLVLVSIIGIVYLKLVRL